MGAFFSSLLGSYSDAVRAKHKQEQDKEEKRVDSELEVLKLAVRDPSITSDAREAAFERMEELTQGKGKKKSGFSFKNLIGKFSDVGQNQGSKQATAARQPQPPTAAPSQGTAPQTGGAAPAAATPPVPTRPRMFKTPQEMGQEDIDQQKRVFEQVTKPEEDYKHKLRLEEIEKQYGQKLTPRTKVVGSSVPLGVDTTGKPIDPKKPYTVLYNNQNQAVAALEEYERPAGSRASGPEAKVDSLKKDIQADAEARGKPISEADAEVQARQLMLRQARASLASTLETTRGKEFANKVRAELEKGVMSPATARSVIGYVGTEAKRRFADDMTTIASGKSIAEIEDDLYLELGTTREEVAGYLRQGAKPPAKNSPKPQVNKFDKDLNPVPSRP